MSHASAPALGSALAGRRQADSRRCARALWIVGLFVVLSASRVAAEPPRDTETEHLRRVINKHADRAHRTRMIVGVTAITLGTLATGAGIYGAVRLDENAWLVEIDRMFEYMLLGSGVLGLSAGTLAIAVDSPQEQLRDDFESSLAVRRPDLVRHTYLSIADYTQRTRHRKHVLLGLGAGMATLGISAELAVAYGPPTLDSSTGQILVVGGSVAFLWGLECLLAGSSRTAFDEMLDDLRAPEQTAVPLFAPIHGGGVIGYAGTF